MKGMARGGAGTPLATYRWNFRSTLGFIADVAPEVFVPADQVFAADTTPGWIGGAASNPTNASTSWGSRAAGSQGLVNAAGRFFSAPVAPGSYKVDLCAGSNFGMLRTAINIFDGHCGDGQNRNYLIWAASTGFGPGAYGMHGPNLYRNDGGTMSGTNPPVHTAGTVSDGGISWTHIKTAVWGIDVTGGNGQFVDARGTSFANPAWQSGAQLSLETFALTAGFITVGRRAGTTNTLRHLGLVGQ